MSRKNYTYRLAVSAVIAAVYFAATTLLAPLAYGPVQFRFSEILNLMAFIDPFYGVGVTMGCFLSNLFSPNPVLLDAVIGTAATALAVLCIAKTKRLFAATLWPTIFNGPMLGLMFTFVDHTPWWLNIGSVALGEFVVVTLIGYPLFKYIILREDVMRVICKKNL